MIEADIPLAKLDNSHFKEFIEKNRLTRRYGIMTISYDTTLRVFTILCAILVLVSDVVTGDFLQFGKNTKNKEPLPLVTITQSNGQGIDAVTSGQTEKETSRDVYVRMTIGTQTNKLNKSNRNSNEDNGQLFRQLYAALMYAATSEFGDAVSSSSTVSSAVRKYGAPVAPSTRHIKYRRNNKRFQQLSQGSFSGVRANTISKIPNDSTSYKDPIFVQEFSSSPDYLNSYPKAKMCNSDCEWYN